MKTFKIYFTMMCLALFAFGAYSCSADNKVETGDHVQNNGKEDEAAKNEMEAALSDIFTEWNASQATVSEHMKNYKLDEQDDSFMKYSKASGTMLSYTFKDGKLMAASILIPTTSKEPISENEVAGYKYLGNINSSRVYTRTQSNSMMTTSNHSTQSQRYLAFGFAPINSDLYEYKNLPTVVSKSASLINVHTAQLNGSMSNIEQTCVCGFEYSTNEDMSNSTIEKLSPKKGDFSAMLKDLKMGTSYYFRAYAIVDGIYYYGEVDKFTTVTVPTYKVGDFYPNDKNPEGVVFTVSSDGTSGKIISLDQKYTCWDSEGLFCKKFGCTSKYDGEENTKKIGKTLPIKQWISEHGDGWYCPATSELKTLGDNYKVVNVTLDSRDYMPLSGAYWTSTENSATNVFVVAINWMNYNTGYTFYHNKNEKNSARAMKKFGY